MASTYDSTQNAAQLQPSPFGFQQPHNLLAQPTPPKPYGAPVIPAVDTRLAAQPAALPSAPPAPGGAGTVPVGPSTPAPPSLFGFAQQHNFLSQPGATPPTNGLVPGNRDLSGSEVATRAPINSAVPLPTGASNPAGVVTPPPSDININRFDPRATDIGPAPGAPPPGIAPPSGVSPMLGGMTPSGPQRHLPPPQPSRANLPPMAHRAINRLRGNYGSR